jgi:hypothetical protein
MTASGSAQSTFGKWAFNVEKIQFAICLEVAFKNSINLLSLTFNYWVRDF